MLVPLGFQAEVGATCPTITNGFDGVGNPHGLEGEGIPLLARIVAIAQAFDNPRSTYPDTSRHPLRDAIRQILLEADTRFDPKTGGAVCTGRAGMQILTPGPCHRQNLTGKLTRSRPPVFRAFNHLRGRCPGCLGHGHPGQHPRNFRFMPRTSASEPASTCAFAEPVFDHVMGMGLRSDLGKMRDTQHLMVTAEVRRRAPITSATALQPRVHLYRKSGTGTRSVSARIVFKANMTRDSSPPDATFANDLSGSPGFAEKTNSMASCPVSPWLITRHARDLPGKRVRSIRRAPNSLVTAAVSFLAASLRLRVNRSAASLIVLPPRLNGAGQFLQVRLCCIQLIQLGAERLLQIQHSLQ